MHRQRKAHQDARVVHEELDAAPYAQGILEASAPATCHCSMLRPMHQPCWSRHQAPTCVYGCAATAQLHKLTAPGTENLFECHPSAEYRTRWLGEHMHTRATPQSVLSDTCCAGAAWQPLQAPVRSHHCRLRPAGHAAVADGKSTLTCIMNGTRLPVMHMTSSYSSQGSSLHHGAMHDYHACRKSRSREIIGSHMCSFLPVLRDLQHSKCMQGDQQRILLQYRRQAELLHGVPWSP